MREIRGTYTDLRILLKTHKHIVSECKRKIEENKQEIERLMRPIGFSTGNISYVDADNIHGQGREEMRYDMLQNFIDEQNKLYHMIEVSTNSIEYYQKAIQNIENELKGLSGKTHQIEYKHLIEGKSIREIAEELDCSERQIYRIKKREG